MRPKLKKIVRLSQAQIQDLYVLYQDQWWSQGRKLKDIPFLLKNSDLVFAYTEASTRRLVVFARVLTDYIYKAFLFDVIVAPDYRKKGVGDFLVNQILSHPKLKRVGHFELYCRPDLIPFYQKWQFTHRLKNLHLMRRMQAG